MASLLLWHLIFEISPPQAAFELPAVFVFELCGPARFINCGGYALE
jgi:hypothetical protein